MSPTDDALGFANRWYPLALETSRKVRLRDGTMIDVISPPVFVATKLEAYLDRGNDDCLASKDIEDIIAVFDGRPEIVEEFSALPRDLLEFVAHQLGHLRNEVNFLYAVEGYLREAPSRSREVFERIDALLHALEGASDSP